MRGMPFSFLNVKQKGFFYYLCVEKKVNRDELITVFGDQVMKPPGVRI